MEETSKNAPGLPVIDKPSTHITCHTVLYATETTKISSTVISIGQVALRTKKVSGGTELKITPKYDNPTLMSKLY